MIFLFFFFITFLLFCGFLLFGFFVDVSVGAYINSSVGLESSVNQKCVCARPAGTTTK